MKIIVDQNIRGAESTFGRHGQLVFENGRRIDPDIVRDADALIVRTATRVDEQLLGDSRVRFVGTTSIGTDHLDTRWLDERGIRWANAPGCNADSAAQYTLAMIWLACERLQRNPEELRAGIVGRGNVGSRVQALFQALGIEAVANDPPLTEAGESGLVPLEEALDRDLVSLHVPLTRSGPHATLGLIGRSQLARMPDGALLVNAARGDIVDGPALLAELRSSRLSAALDVWPGEPVIDPELLRRVTVATPHIAGYSQEGRLNGTRIVYRSFCEWAGVPKAAPAPQNGGPCLTEMPKGRDPLSAVLDAACFVEAQDAAMRRIGELPPEQRIAEFDRQRRDYPVRREFSAWSVRCTNSTAAERLRGLGFNVNQTI